MQWRKSRHRMTAPAGYVKFIVLVSSIRNHDGRSAAAPAPVRVTPKRYGIAGWVGLFVPMTAFLTDPGPPQDR
jgi:hypothetical protein